VHPQSQQNGRPPRTTHQVSLQFWREHVTDRKSVKMGITVAPSVAMPGELSPDNLARGKLIFAAPFATNFRDLSTVAVTARSSRSRSGNKAITFTTHDLPFPCPQATKLVTRWSKSFMANLFDWVATLENPWQANSSPDFSIKVKDTWTLVFPDLEHEVNHPAIEFLVRSARCLPLILINFFLQYLQAGGAVQSWQSKISSNTLAMIDILFEGKGAEAIQGALNTYLPAPRFLWNKPEATVH
jgi:hypothetical protein